MRPPELRYDRFVDSPSTSRRGRWLWWLVGLTVAVALTAVVVIPRLLGSDGLRHRVERRLSTALGREVTIERLEVESERSAVVLFGVRVADPPQFGGGALLVAQQMRLEVGIDALLDDAIEGTLTAHGVDVRVVRVDAQTNLHGLGRASTDEDPIPLHLAVALTDCSVELVDRAFDDSVTLSHVDLEGVVGTAADDKRAGLSVKVAEVKFGEHAARDVAVHGQFTADGLMISRATAGLGQSARLVASGGIELVEGKPAEWSLDVTLEDAALRDDLVPVAAALYPPLAALEGHMAEAPDAEWGRLTLATHLVGHGLHWSKAKAGLAGRGELTLEGLRVPAETLLGRLAALAGHEGGPLTLGRASSTFTLAGGWITLGSVSAEGAVIVPPVTGRVALDGRLELEVDLMPLVAAYGGGVYAAARGVSSSIPVRVRGTVDKPEIKAPSARSIAKGLVGGAIHRLLRDP